MPPEWPRSALLPLACISPSLIDQRYCIYACVVVLGVIDEWWLVWWPPGPLLAKPDDPEAPGESGSMY